MYFYYIFNKNIYIKLPQNKIENNAMDIKEENTGSMLIVHVNGEIDLDKTDDLRAKIASVIDDNSNILLMLPK